MKTGEKRAKSGDEKNRRGEKGMSDDVPQSNVQTAPCNACYACLLNIIQLNLLPFFM